MNHQVGDILYAVAGLGDCRITAVFPIWPTRDDIRGQLCTGISVEPINDEKEPDAWMHLPRHP